MCLCMRVYSAYIHFCKRTCVLLSWTIVRVIYSDYWVCIWIGWKQPPDLRQRYHLLMPRLPSCCVDATTFWRTRSSAYGNEVNDAVMGWRSVILVMYILFVISDETVSHKKSNKRLHKNNSINLHVHENCITKIDSIVYTFLVLFSPFFLRSGYDRSYKSPLG